MKNEWRPGIKG